MRCEECQGKGFKTIVNDVPEIFIIQYVVCPECYGFGIVSCCEGAERLGQIGGSDRRR